MQGEFLSIETAQKIAKVEKIEKNWKEINQYIDNRFKAIQFDYENNIIDKFELVVRENELLKLKERIKNLEGKQ